MDADDSDAEDTGFGEGNADDQNTTLQYEQASAALA